MVESILTILIIVCTGSILRTYPKANKQYKECLKRSLIVSTEKLSKKEQALLWASAGALMVFVVLIILSIWMKVFNEALLLGIAILFLGIYYTQEGTMQNEWTFCKEGLMVRRSIGIIEWQNILTYHFEKLKREEILKISYKGKGLVIRKMTLKIEEEQIKAIRELLEKNVIITP